MAHRPDAEIIATTHNTARFFTENRQISWVALLIVIAWGIYGYDKMPKRKDPDIPVKEAQVDMRMAGRQRRPRRAAGHAQDRAEARRGLRGSRAVGRRVLDQVADARRTVGRQRPGRLQRQGPQAHLQRDGLEAEKHHGPAQGRGTDPVLQRLWRYGGADADGGQSEGNRGRDFAARQGDRSRDKGGARQRGRRVEARDDSGRVSAESRFAKYRRERERDSWTMPVEGRGARRHPPDRRQRLRWPRRYREFRRRAAAGIHGMRRGKIRLRFIRSGHLAAGRDSQSRRRPGAARYSRGRQVQLPRARRFHRFDQARADRSAAGIEDPDLRRPAAVDQSRIFAVQTRRLWHHAEQDLAGAGGAKYRVARGLARNQRPQSHRAAVGRVQKRKGHRRRNHRQVGHRYAAVSSRPRHDHARLPGPCALSQYLHRARLRRRMADASRDHDRGANAFRRTDSRYLARTSITSWRCCASNCRRI